MQTSKLPCLEMLLVAVAPVDVAKRAARCCGRGYTAGRQGCGDFVPLPLTFAFLLEDSGHPGPARDHIFGYVPIAPALLEKEFVHDLDALSRDFCFDFIESHAAKLPVYPR